MIQLSNKMTEQLAQNQSALKEVNKLASVKNLDNSKEKLLKNEEFKSVEEMVLKLLDKVAKGDLTKLEAAKIIQQNSSLEPKDNLSQELKKLVQMLEKMPEFKEAVKNLKEFLKPIINLINPEKTLPEQIKNSGILLEANLKNEIVQNPLPKSLNLLLDELKLQNINSKQLNLPTAKELNILAQKIKSQPVLLKSDIDKVVENLLKDMKILKPNLNKSPNLELIKDLKNLENLEKFIHHIASKSTKKTSNKEISIKDFQKLSNAIDKVFDKLIKNLDLKIDNLKQTPENSKIKESLNEVKEILKEIINQKNEAKPELSSKPNTQNTAQDIKNQSEKELLTPNKTEKNIQENTKLTSNKEELLKAETKPSESSNLASKTTKEQAQNIKNDIQTNLENTKKDISQENIIKNQDKNLSAKEIIKEKLMSDKELKAEQFLRTQNKTIPENTKTQGLTEPKSTAIPAKNVLESVKTTTQNFTKNYSQTISQNSPQNFTQQNTQNSLENTIETIKQETLTNLEDKIKIATKKLESAMQTLDKKSMLLNETNEQTKHLLKNFEHFSKDLPAKNLPKINDLPANLQSDVKNTLLQIEQTAQNSKSANAQNVSNLANKLVAQIEMHQFISYVGDIAHCYVPYLWDGMKGGHMSFKRTEQEKFYCKIDLNFQKYGQILIMLGLSKNKYLDVSIATQSESLKERIQEDLRHLRLALSSVGMIIKHLSVSKLNQAEEKKTNYEYYNNIDLGMNLRA